MGKDSAAPTDSHSTPIHNQPSLSKPQKKKSSRKQRKDSGLTEPISDEATNEEHVATPSCNLPQSELEKKRKEFGKEKDLEKAKTAQAKEITSLKKRVKQLENRRKSKDASKQGRKIKDLDADAEVTLVNETQEMNDDNLMFDTSVLEEHEIEFEKVVEEPVVSVATTTKSIPVSATEVVTTTSASVVIPDELTLAQTLIEIKTAKPKPVTTATTTVTSVKPRAKGIIFHDQEEHVSLSTKIFSFSQSQLSQVKDKGKGKMVEPEVPLKKKNQVALDEEMARNIEAQLQAKLIKEERLASSKIAGDELESNLSKKQNIDELVEVEKDEAEMKRHIEIVKDDEVSIDAIPLATKPPVIVEYQIDKDGRMGYFKLIRADGSLKKYSSMIKIIQGIDREDLETL
ncbi:hypothetical protein Tco_0112133 [Tanacetum coccineum]